MQITRPRRPRIGLILIAAASLAAIPPVQADETAPRVLPVAAPRPAALAAESVAGSSYRLQYRFEPNADVRFQVQSNSTVIVTKGDHTQRAVNQTFTEKHFRVVSVDDQMVATLETYIDRVKMKYQVGEQDEKSFDSFAQNAGDQGFDRVRETIHVPLARLLVDSSGKLLKVIPLASEPDDTAQTQGEHQNIVIVLPEKPISVGEEWSDRFQVKVNVSRTLKKPVELVRKYKLDAVTGTLAHISVKMAVITPVTDPMARAQLIQRTPSGKIVFDMARGMIVSREMTCDNTELGIHGPNSSIRATSERWERIQLPPAVAHRPAKIASAKDPTSR